MKSRSVRLRQKVVRNRQNQVSGLVLGFAILIGMIALDPLCLYQNCYPDSLFGRLKLLFGGMLISLGGMVVFWRPRVVVGPQSLLVLNPLRDVTIPLERIDTFEEGDRYTRIIVGEQRITAWGLEQAPVVGAFGGRPQLAADLVAQQTAPGAAVVRRWRRPEPLEVVVLVGWLGYLVFGLLLGTY